MAALSATEGGLGGKIEEAVSTGLDEGSIVFFGVVSASEDFLAVVIKLGSLLVGETASLVSAAEADDDSLVSEEVGNVWRWDVGALLDGPLGLL